MLKTCKEIVKIKFAFFKQKIACNYISEIQFENSLFYNKQSTSYQQ